MTALVLSTVAASIFEANAYDAALLAANAGLLSAFAAYLFFSPAVREFQRPALPAATG